MKKLQHLYAVICSTGIYAIKILAGPRPDLSPASPPSAPLDYHERLELNKMKLIVKSL